MNIFIWNYINYSSSTEHALTRSKSSLYIFEGTQEDEIIKRLKQRLPRLKYFITIGLLTKFIFNCICSVAEHFIFEQGFLHKVDKFALYGIICIEIHKFAP